MDKFSNEKVLFINIVMVVIKKKVQENTMYANTFEKFDKKDSDIKQPKTM